MTARIAIALLALLTRCAPPETDCTLHMVAQMPLQIQDDLLIVPAGIHGKIIHLVVDTGAERTTIAASASHHLDLIPDPRHTTQSLGIGGITRAPEASVGHLSLGGVEFPLERAAVAAFQLHSDHGLDADGLLGADILLLFDLDIDVPNGQLTLYRPRLCPTAKPPWHEPAVEINGVRASGDRLLMPFNLDGVPGMAILDTGAQQDVLGLDMARRLHLSSLTSMAADPTITQHGVGPAEVIAHLHQFKLLRIGPLSQRSPRLAVTESEAGIGDAVVGEAFLRNRRVWMSFSNRQIYVSLKPRPETNADRRDTFDASLAATAPGGH